MTKKSLQTIFAVYFIVILVIVAFLPHLYNRPDIWVMGLPLTAFVVYFSSLMLAVGLAVFYYAEQAIDNAEGKEK